MPSDQREEKIKAEAKEILDKFAKALSKIKTPEEKKIGFVEREEDRREEKAGEEKDSDFAKRFMDNAPNTKDNCILGEKGAWK